MEVLSLGELEGCSPHCFKFIKKKVKEEKERKQAKQERREETEGRTVFMGGMSCLLPTWFAFSLGVLTMAVSIRSFLD